MMTLGDELDAVLRGSPALTSSVLQVVLPRLKSLILHFGPTCTGPYHVTTRLHDQVAIHRTCGAAIDAIIVADGINKDPAERKAAWVIRACDRAGGRRTSDTDLDQTLEHDLGPGDDP